MTNKSPLVVVQILPALNNGGVERGTVEVANFLAQNGHTSIIISAGGKMLEDLSEKVEHISLSVGKKSLTSLLLINKLKRLLIEKKVDIVHARSRLPAWLVYKSLAKIKKHKPRLFTTVHGLYSVKRYSSIMARGDRVIAVSMTAADYIKTHYSNYLKVEPQIIYRGIDPDEFSYGHEPGTSWLQDLYTKHQQLVGCKIVLLPGRLTSLKGAKDLLFWLKYQENNAKLVFTANPKNDMYAQRLYHWFKDKGVEQRIVWIGLQKSMADLYGLADIVVSTSTRPESFGRTVIESLAVGTPVVAYNHGGVGEILNEIFPQGQVTLGDFKELSNKINQVLQDKPIIENRQPYLLNNMLQQTIELYHEATND